jgi:DNA-binding NtrC family response regulator
MAKVLLVDDEVTMVQMVTELLRHEGHEVFPFTNGPAAVEALETVHPELVITDLYLDKTQAFGFEILTRARALSPPALVIRSTAFGRIETAVEAMKQGAYDYLEKPFKLDALRLCIQRALSYSDAVSENVYLRKQLKTRYQFNRIIGTSAPMQEVFRMIERVADTDSTILVRGESGTGKELVARALHFNSRRQNAPFVPINCSALPENLLESELFGHRKGAFTGALADKKGLFEEADGGTIFLDEIGSMPPMLQSRLLRVLQEREVRRVGENIPFTVNVRVLAATNEPLEKRLKEGTFREDLYYRLNVILINLPNLRERKEDIPLLVSHFLRQRLNPKTGAPIRITRQAVEVFTAHDWPGNVRELENALERACALCEEGLIRVGDLPPTFLAFSRTGTGDTVFQTKDEVLAPAPSGVPANTPPLVSLGFEQGGGTANQSIIPLKSFLREQEVAYLNRVLAQANGDKDKAASLLGISLATLYRKLAEDDL